MSAMAHEITSFTIVYWSVYSCADQRKHQSFTSLAFVRGIHRWPVNSPHTGPVTRNMSLFDDVIMVFTLRRGPPGSLVNTRHIAMPVQTSSSTATLAQTAIYHDDVIKWQHFPRYWPFVWGIHRSTGISRHTKASDSQCSGLETDSSWLIQEIMRSMIPHEF